MKADIASEFKNLLNKYFDPKSALVEWTKLSIDWQKAFELNAHFISNEDRAFLDAVLDEVQSIVVEMPGLKTSSPAVDWKKWSDDDEFLVFLISREALGFPMTKEGYLKASGDAVKSGLFNRPFRDEIKFLSKIHQYLASFVSASDEKKYRIVKIVQLHPGGQRVEILERGLSIEEAMNKSVGYFTDGIVSSETPYFEEDI